MRFPRPSILGWCAIALTSLFAFAACDAGASPSQPDRPIAPATQISADQGDAVGEARIPAPSGSFAGDAIRTVVALGAVLALALVLRQVAKRLSDPLAARRPSGVVQILSRFPVGKGQSVQLLAVGTRVLCVHHSGSAMSTLCEFTDPQEIALLRTRIEAGAAGREKFEGELTRSLERDRDTLLGQRAKAPASQPTPTPTETIDLTKRRPRGLALVGGANANGVRA